MKQKEFKRFLASKGVTFQEGGSHTKAYALNGKQSTIPRHAKDLPEPLRKAILKQLGITEE